MSSSKDQSALPLEEESGQNKNSLPIEEEARVRADASDIVIRVKDLSKCYQIYGSPRDRLKQFVVPRLQRLSGKAPNQYFREFWALKDISFEIKKGESVGIIGRNGSGKSTLLQLICGTLSPTGGSVESSGRIAALLELGSGFNPEFTGRENVYMNGAVLGMGKAEVDARFNDIIAFAEIGDFIDQPVKTYSSGMIVRLAFAVAINVEPEILVVDEALAVGDVGFQVRCFNKIGELQKRGTTFIFVSHSPSAITQLCRRAIVLHQGQLLLDCEPYPAIKTYTKLCNADDLDIEKITSNIVQSQKQGERVDKRGAVIVSGNGESILGEKDEPKVFGAYFDEGLSKAVSPKLMGEMDITISEVWIASDDGSSVNVIPQGHSATLNFTVRFNRPVGCCRLAWTLRTIQGFLLGGGATHSAGEGVEFYEEEIEVSSRFYNYFSPGEYLIDINVRGGGSADNAHLCTVNDAIIFRSITNARIWRNGIVNCLAEDGFVVRHGDGNVEKFN